MIDQCDSSGRSPANADGRSSAHHFAHEAMACTFEVFIPHEEARYAEHVARAAFDEVDRVEQELSRFIDHSDVARINALRLGQSLRVGMETFECLQLAAAIHRETDGAFDVTVGSIARTSGAPEDSPPKEDEDERPPYLPLGMHRLELDAGERTVTVRAEGLQVDLGGIGKGYALDRVVELLREWSVRSALLHAGQSSVFALGNPPGGDSWSVQLRDPSGAESSAGSVGLRYCALGGSGSFLRGPHITDPRTGRPARSTLGAWAMASSAAVADALSTAFMVMSPMEIEAYCHEHEDVSAALALPVPGGYEFATFGPGFSPPEAE